MNKRYKLRIAGVENDSVVDGPGLRLAIFTQGCRHLCNGCHNPQSHDESGGYVVYLGEILAYADNNPLIDGVTISGGEPFLQYEPLTVLAAGLKMRGLNIMVYTGYTWEELMKHEQYKEFIKLIDVLVDGRFVLELKSYSLKYKGSSNQRVIDVGQSLERGEVVLWENKFD